MRIARLITRCIDAFTEVLGRVAAWSSVAMVLVTCYIVFIRYLLDSGSIPVQESVIYLNALLFILSAGFTLKHNGHVRVDVLYSKASPRYQAFANLFGTLFLLLPVCIFIFLYSWDYVLAAWRVKEGSGEAGGLPFVYLLKTLILILSTVLVIQGLAEFLRNLTTLLSPDDSMPGDHHAGTQVEEGSTTL